LEWYSFGTTADRLAVRIRFHVLEALLRLPISFFDQKANDPTSLVSFIDSSANNIIGLAGATMGAILESVFTLV
jgi:ATP-binding cassette, subfamily B (MDR/TAP), member 1